MRSSSQLISVLVLTVLIGLTVVASIALYRVQALSLPIPTAAAIATVLLPLVTTISLPGAQSLNRRAKHAFSGLELVIFILLIIYETAVATLALTHMAPPSDLTCGLDRQWAQLFSSKNAVAIRRIQDRHQCCGLRSVLDRAWPFVDRSHTAASCSQAFDRQRSCFAGWRQDEQVTGGLMLLVAVAVFSTKVILLVVYRARSQFFSAPWSEHASRVLGGHEDHGSDGGIRREDGYRGQIEGPYRDDAPEHDDQALSSQGNGGAIDRAVDQGPVVQPARFHNESMEWRQAGNVA